MPFTVLLAIFGCSANSSETKTTSLENEVSFIHHEGDQTIEVLINNEPFTNLRWTDNLTKPVLYPIMTSGGTAITRGFPIDPKPGERADHPHQIGNWFTYGNVNGSDFWGNGSKGLATRNANGGIIDKLKIESMSGGEGEGVLTTSAIWIDSSGREILDEKTEYHFIAEDSVRIIDRIVTLTARGSDVTMDDTKEGMFGIRVARQLELPAQGEITLYSARGEPEKVKALNNETITGQYKSSNGDTGIGVWGTRARWMDLYGSVDGELISVVICDHPDNISYPTWWHARGYGLFAANPLGARDFTKETETVDFTIPADESATFRYRIAISSGFHLNDDQINAIADQFADQY